MMKYGIGIIGFGGFGAFLQKTWNAMENAHVVAIADQDPKRNPSDSTRFYNRYQDILRDPAVDIVSVCTPPSTHGTIGRQVLQAGKHLLVEKPIATRLRDATQLIEWRDRTGRVAAVNYMLRFNPIIEQLEAIARGGTFGHLRRAVVENYAQDESLPRTHWFWDDQVAGGILVEHAVHFLDLVDLISGAKVVHVEGAAHRRNADQVDQVMATVLYESGLIASHYHEFARPNVFEETSIRLVFDALQIDLEGWIPMKGKVSALASDTSLKLLEGLPGWKMNSKSGFDPSSGKLISKTVSCGGQSFKVNSMVNGTFGFTKSKLEIYADCLRNQIDDMIKTIEKPSRPLRVPLEAGLHGLSVALRARKSSRRFT